VASGMSCWSQPTSCLTGVREITMRNGLKRGQRLQVLVENTGLKEDYED